MRQIIFGLAIVNLLIILMTFLIPYSYFFFFSIFLNTALVVALGYFAAEEGESKRVQNEINQRLRIQNEKLEEKIKELEKKHFQSQTN